MLTNAPAANVAALPSRVTPLRRPEVERDVEAYLKKLCGLLGWQCLKWVSPAHKGVPDRIVIGAGRVWFVELKKPGEEPTALQSSVHSDIRKCGVEVYVLDSRAAVHAWVVSVAEAANA